jgi:SlyX protein
MAGELEARIEKLETTVAYQEQVIDDLNGTVTSQWQEIDALKRQLAKLSEQVREVEANPALAPQDEPPPPHY